MRRLASQARVARLGTIDPDGRSHLVPLCFALDGSSFYSEVDQKPKSSKRLRRVENIIRDPRVTILVDHYEEEWPKVWWVRMRGSGRLVEGDEERDRGRRLLIDKYPQYQEDPPTGELFAVEVEEWLGWSYSPIE